MASQTPVSHAISTTDLARTLGSGQRPVIVGVRPSPAFVASQHSTCGSLDCRQRNLTTESQTWPSKELAR